MKNSKSLIQFDSEKFGTIRSTVINDTPWFVAKDICDILGIKNVTQSMQQLETFERSMFNIGRQGAVNIINESGFYTLVLRSRKPIAKPFRLWVTQEVLPSLRKTGAYIQPNREQEAIDHYFPTFSDELKLAMVKELQQKNEQLQQFYDDLLNTEGLLDMNTVAKELEIGEYALFAYLRGKKIMFYNKDKINIPYERFRKEGKFKTKEVICPDGKTRSVTYATRKGLDYIRKTMRKDGLLEVAR